MSKLSNNEIALAIHKATAGKTGHALHTQLQNVVRFLNNKRLMGKAPQILERLKKIINKEEGIVEANLSYAGKLHRDAKHHIEHVLKKRYKARDVIIHDMVDEGLVGGFKIEAEDEVIDLSIKNTISRLQEHITA